MACLYNGTLREPSTPRMRTTCKLTIKPRGMPLRLISGRFQETNSCACDAGKYWD
jgi:hypothetical protein